MTGQLGSCGKTTVFANECPTSCIPGQIGLPSVMSVCHVPKLQKPKKLDDIAEAKASELCRKKRSH